MIGDSAKELLGRITKFAEHLDNMGSNLENAVKHYNSAVRSYNTRLLPSARDTAELAGEIAAPQEIDTIALTTQDTPTKRLPTAD